MLISGLSLFVCGCVSPHAGHTVLHCRKNVFGKPDLVFYSVWLLQGELKLNLANLDCHFFVSVYFKLLFPLKSRETLFLTQQFQVMHFFRQRKHLSVMVTDSITIIILVHKCTLSLSQLYKHFCHFAYSLWTKEFANTCSLLNSGISIRHTSSHPS